MYDGIFSLDLIKQKDIKIVEKRIIKKISQLNNCINYPNNHRKQLIVVNNGKVFNYYKSFFKLSVMNIATYILD